MQGGEDVVENALVLQDGHPGVSPDEEVHPHGDHDDGHKRLLDLGLGAGHDIGQGIGQHQADQRGDDRQLQRTPEDEQVGADLGGGSVVLHDAGRGGEEALDIFQGELKIHVRKGIVGDKDQGDQDEQDGPDAVRPQRQVIGPEHPALVAGDVFFHSSSSSLTSDSSSSSLEKEE